MAPPQRSDSPFNYDTAFCRNLGLVTPEEQLRLNTARVAIPGLGGVGGVHLTTLARMGVGRFHIADFDRFELQNFNRQAGAKISTLGLLKVDVMKEQALEINPELEVVCFHNGLTPDNISSFLNGVDVVVDSLDFFALEARELLFDEAERRGIPLISAAPLGMSTAWLVLRPGAMPWRKYFALHFAKTTSQKYVLFALGLAPKATHLPYMDRNYVDVDGHRGPSLSPAVQLCAGVASTETLKILLGRGPVDALPRYNQFDAYRLRWRRGRLLFGNRGWIQRLKFIIFNILYTPKK